jgi:hypothetical protein
MTNFDSGGDGGTWLVPFVHGLGYRPIVDATAYYEGNDNIRNPLPWDVYNSNPDDYASHDLHVGIEKVDEIYIYVRFAALNSNGYTILSANFADHFVFKFYCSTDQTV